MRGFERFELSDMENNIFSIATNELYLVTDYNKLQYPNYYRWFYGTNIPRILSGKGEIIFYVDGCSKIAGLVILKKDVELKICTFMVRPEYRRMGLGSRLAEDSFKKLGTGFPGITIPEARIDEFEPLITKYGWVESRVIDDYYSPEIVFNEPKDIIVGSQDLVDDSQNIITGRQDLSIVSQDIITGRQDLSIVSQDIITGPQDLVIEPQKRLVISRKAA